MSLRVGRRSDTGKLWITGTVRAAGAKEGVRIRRRAGTDSLSAAREEAAALEARILRDAWHGPRKNVSRTFGEALKSYLGHEKRHPATQAYLERLAKHIGDMPLVDIDQSVADGARAAMFKPDAAPATLRRGLFTPLTAVLNHAAHPARKWCDRPQFDVPKESRGRTEFLMPSQASALLAGAQPRPRELFRFLLCTGCRMGEVLRLDWRDVDLAGARAILWEGETKSGGRRVVELYPAALAVLSALPHREGPVFLTHRKRAYRTSEDGGGQLRTAWGTAMTAAKLTGFTPHHLRHTWATWHYAIHRDLLKLKVDGGWHAVRMCERYAHVMPVGYEAAIRELWGLPWQNWHGVSGHRPQVIGEIEEY